MTYNIDERLSKLERRKNLEDIKPENVAKVHKMMLLEDFLEQKEIYPEIKAAGLAKSIGTSLSTINRTRKDLGVKSFYRYDIPVNKSTRTKKEVEVTRPSFKYSDCNKEFKSKPAMASHSRVHSKKTTTEIKSGGLVDDPLEQYINHRPEHEKVEENRAREAATVRILKTTVEKYNKNVKQNSDAEKEIEFDEQTKKDLEERRSNFSK